MTTPTKGSKTPPNKRQVHPVEDVGVLEAPEEVLSTMTKEGKRRWIYPTPSTGRWQRWRLILGWFLVFLFIALPIIPINGYPAMLLDVVHREFALFGIVFYPTDTLLGLFFMVALTAAIFLFTALLGRVWCGWACPQTVYLEFVFRPIERLIEGKEHVRAKRDQGPLTWDKAWRKGLKYAIYLVISLVLAHTFVAYFAGWDELLVWMQRSPREHWGFFLTMAITTGLVLFNFAYFREQMCTIACPYARIQSVLLDPDSLIVSYDPTRGEPRSKRGKNVLRQEEQGLIPALGDCIDCGACVRTCPTGIDIRNGLQMECIACTQCIDACDDIMDKIGKPRGLIRYTSERELEGGKTRILRPRTVLYSIFIALIGAFLAISLLSRGSYDINVARSVGEPFMELPDGRIANRLRFRVRNQQNHASSFVIEAVRPAGAEVTIVGASPITLDPQEMKRVEAWVVVPAEDFQGKNLDALFRLRFDDGVEEEASFTLLGPSK